MSTGDISSPTLETRVSTSLETSSPLFRGGCLQVFEHRNQVVAAYRLYSDDTTTTSGFLRFPFRANTSLLDWKPDSVEADRQPSQISAAHAAEMPHPARQNIHSDLDVTFCGQSAGLRDVAATSLSGHMAAAAGMGAL